ncbi:MAG: hypothetical protein KAS02_01075 [Candidatus Pacebacteria bacterium]|nr:hypothetical protein [Candidatus Paceibacterota bacterium]
MDPEDKKIIRDNLEIAQDNQKMLKKMRRSMILGGFIRIIYWVIIISLSLGAYYYLQPYIDSARETLHQIQGGVNVVSDGVTTTTQYTGDVVDSVLDFGKSIIEF